MTTNGNAALAKVEDRPGGGQLSVAQVRGRLDTIEELMRSAMVNDLDYGKIPGTGSKPTLLKPGAEKLSVMFQLDPEFKTEETWHDDGHLTVKTYCTIYHSPTGGRLGGATAICSTRESKYAYRGGARVCPECGKPAIKRSKFPPRDQPDATPGYYCFAKVGGCGANFGADDERITSQSEGRVANPDLADSYNTVIRICEKRSFVAAVRQVTGASALFDEELPTVEHSATDRHEPPARDTRRPLPPPPQQQRRTQAPQANPPGPAPVKPDVDPAESAELRRQFGELIASCTTREAVLMAGEGVNKFKDRLTPADYQAMRAQCGEALKKFPADKPPANDDSRAKAAEAALKVLASADTLDAVLAFEKAPPLPKHFMTVKDAHALGIVGAIDKRKLALAADEKDDYVEKLQWDVAQESAFAAKLNIPDIDAMDGRAAVKLALALRAEAQKAGLLGDPEPSAEEYAMAHGTGEGG